MIVDFLPLLCYGSMGLSAIVVSYNAYADYQATSNTWSLIAMLFCIQTALLSLILLIKHL